MYKTSNLLWGITFIIIGVIFGLNALNIVNINIFFNGWWTLIIIIPNFIDLFKEKEKTSNIIGLIIGTLLLLGCNNIIDFNLIFKLIVPIMLIIVGVSFIFKDTINGKIKNEIKKINHNNNKEYYATFSGQDLNFSNEVFNNCDLNAIFGGIKCNLQESQIKKDTIINANAIFGGITIFVPENVTVKIISTSIFGGISNKKTDKSNNSKITLYIYATCMFGGVEIK